MSSLPAGWEKAELGEVCQLIRGVSFASSQKQHEPFDGSVACLRTANVQNELEFDDLWFIPRSLVHGEDQFAQPGDVVISMANSLELVGKVAIHRGTYSKNLTFGAFLAVVRSIGLLPEFLFYQMRSEAFQAAIRATARRTINIANLAMSELNRLEVVVPPLEEQARIVAAISTARRHARNAIAQLLTARSSGAKLRQSILAAAFRGDLTADWREKNPDVEPAPVPLTGKVQQTAGGRAATTTVIPGRFALSVGRPDLSTPTKWKWVRLTDVARLESGHTPRREVPEYWDGDVPWIGIQDARENHGQWISKTRNMISTAGLENSAARLLPAKTVCLSRTASVGYVTIMARPMATSQDFVNWVCSDYIEPEFLAFLFLAESESLLRFGKGSTHTTIYFPEVKAFHVCVPPKAEQIRIVELIKDALARADQVNRAVASAEAKLEKLDAAVLAKAFRGELVPQDPTDKRASVLLERIRAQRAAAEGESTGKRRTKSRGREATSEPEPVAIAQATTPRLPIRKRSLKPEHQSPRLTIDDHSLEEVLAAIRRVVTTGDRDRDALIRDVARELGFARTGTRVHAAIDSAINAASRRLIIRSERGVFTLYSPSIDHYEKDELKQLFLSAIGTTWWDRDEAIRATARYLGFRRTGDKIDHAIRSVINGLIRTARLERDGKRVRRV